MPKPFQYKSGSLIYFQGDAADKIFILQKGKISLTYQDIETGEDVRDTVQPGEFFGVKSALGRYPREENAMAMADSAIMAFTVPEFEAVAQANTRIIMKMLTVFSNQMRRIHSQVSSLMEKEDSKPDEGLYNTGEYYLKNKRYSQARYVFGRYLTYYPSGKRAIQATKNLEIAETCFARYGDGKGPAVVLSGGSGTASAAPMESPASMTMPSMEDSSSTPADPGAAAKAYYDAVSLISREKYQEAFLAFKAIVDADEDPEWAARSSFEIGRCMFMLGKFEECIRYYTIMFTKYPRHPDLKDAMFIMGQCNERIGKKDQAAAFYKKILSMAGGDTDGTISKVKRALKALEG